MECIEEIMWSGTLEREGRCPPLCTGAIPSMLMVAIMTPPAGDWVRKVAARRFQVDGSREDWVSPHVWGRAT